MFKALGTVGTSLPISLVRLFRAEAAYVLRPGVVEAQMKRLKCLFQLRFTETNKLRERGMTDTKCKRSSKKRRSAQDKLNIVI